MLAGSRPTNVRSTHTCSSWGPCRVRDTSTPLLSITCRRFHTKTKVLKCLQLTESHSFKSSIQKRVTSSSHKTKRDQVRGVYLWAGSGTSQLKSRARSTGNFSNKFHVKAWGFQWCREHHICSLHQLQLILHRTAAETTVTLSLCFNHIWGESLQFVWRKIIIERKQLKGNHIIYKSRVLKKCLHNRWWKNLDFSDNWNKIKTDLLLIENQRLATQCPPKEMILLREEVLNNITYYQRLITGCFYQDMRYATCKSALGIKRHSNWWYSPEKVFDTSPRKMWLCLCVCLRVCAPTCTVGVGLKRVCTWQHCLFLHLVWMQVLVCSSSWMRAMDKHRERQRDKWGCLDAEGKQVVRTRKHWEAEQQKKKMSVKVSGVTIQ